jgi:cobalamin synthase
MYGFIAALLYIIPVWYYLYEASYRNGWVVYIGSIFFMFVIMLYSFKLSRRKPEYKSSWMMIVAAHSAVMAGIILSVVLTFCLCLLYIPGFLTGHSPSDFLQYAPAGLNNKNIDTVMQVFVPATIENFGAGGFMAVLGPYVFKRNQTRDKPVSLEPKVKNN